MQSATIAEREAFPVVYPNEPTNLAKCVCFQRPVWPPCIYTMPGILFVLPQSLVGDVASLNGRSVALCNGGTIYLLCLLNLLPTLSRQVFQPLLWNHNDSFNY